MEEPLKICLTCLSTDRCLVSLHKIKMLLQKIHFDVMKTSHGGVCWECWSILVKFYKFKKKAKIAQAILSKTTQHPNIRSLSTLSSKINILYDYQYKYSIDPLDSCDTKLKGEPETIKQEIIDQSDDNIDLNSDFDERKSKIDEETENIYEDILETKLGNNLLRKHEIPEQCNCGVTDQISYLDEFTNIPEKVQNEIEHKLKKQTCLQCVNKVKINYAEVTLNEKLSEILTENVFVETIETIPNKKIIRKKTKKNLERDKREIQEKFTQVVLTEEEMLKVREEKRNHYNFKKIPYKCDSCVLGFTRKDTYSLHMKKKHDESIGDEICDVCHIRFRHKMALENHRNKHFMVFKCRLCKYETHEYTSVVNHCRSKHVNDEPNQIHCSQCDIVVQAPEELEKHMQSKHTLFCVCGVKFKDKSNLRSHISRAHSILRNFICDICEKTFKTKTRLETHMATHNGSIAKKLAYCQQCNIQYKNIQVYRSHLTSSSKHSEGYPCSECNKKFRSKGYLKQHYNFYHLRKSQYKCEVCNKLFISNFRLRNHKQQYHGLSRPRNHSCGTCGKKFYSSGTLRSHQLTHSSQRSFMCADCGATFKQSAALYTHTRLVHKRADTRKNT